MGGTAFAKHQPSFLTPRMPPTVYKLVRTETIALLKHFYEYVQSPTDAPGKDSFGDVDIVIFKSHEDSLDEAQKSREEITIKLKEILGARDYLLRKNDPVISFVILWPKTGCSSIKEIATDERYVQVDIQICSTYHDFHYRNFHDSHGGLLSILNLIILPFGLKINNKGMYIRIASIEAEDQKRSMVFLTSDPTEILKFIGVDPGKWWKEMSSIDEMFHYAASCRMFNSEEFEEMPENTSNSGNINTSKIRKRWTHKQRARYAKLPIFVAWIDNFIPKCCAMGLYKKPDLFFTRDQIKDDAFRTFKVRDEFQEKEMKWALEKNDDQILKVGLRGSVPTENVEPAFRAAGLRVLKEVVLDQKPWIDNLIPNEVLRDKNGFHDMKKVKRWVSDNWQEAGKIGLARQHEKSIANNKKKLHDESL